MTITDERKRVCSVVQYMSITESEISDNSGVDSELIVSQRKHYVQPIKDHATR